jgi:hypothetical protein
MDVEGYGERPGQSPVERLLEDSRTPSPAGVERAAAGWDRHAGDHGAWQRAEQAAIRELEASGEGERWDELRNRLLGLTERGTPLVAWRSEHGETGHKAENALLGAALAILAGRLDRQQRETLLRPMAEAMPWLLSSAPPGA